MTFEDFTNEQIYNKVNKLLDDLECHPFSKNLTIKDATAINVVMKRLREISNDLYNARQDYFNQER